MEVLATGSLQGVEGVLPDDVAWAYRIGPGVARSPAPASARRMLVRGATPPPDLRLPPLGTAGVRVEGDWTVLEGEDATPGRVLSEMRSASVVDLEVHGWVDPLVPDGAALALSEDRDGRYALTPSMFRPGLLDRATAGDARGVPGRAGEPIPEGAVELAQCAGRRAGARAVLASGPDLPDAEVG